jgi:peptidoglycan/LPS O-acetylase OafA/YrhL
MASETSRPLVTSAASLPKKIRLDSIDALRGLAALSVALYHAWGHDGTYPWYSIGIVTQTPNAHWLSYLTFPFRWGYLGVSFFLVLSGFCIHLPAARNLVGTGSYQFQAKAFYLRRLWRLYPAYFIAVVTTTILLWGMHLAGATRLPGHSDLPSAWDVFAHLTLLHGYFESTFYSIASVFWSLALEFQLYLAYPFFLYLFRRLGTLRAVIILTAVALMWRLVLLNYFGAGLVSISAHGTIVGMGSVLGRMPEWLFGALLAEVYFRREELWDKLVTKHFPLLSFGVAFFALAILSTLDERGWSLTDPLFGIAFAFFVAATILPREAEHRQRHSWAHRWLIGVGVFSYSLYLFHLQLSWLISPIIDKIPGLLLPFLARILWLMVSIRIIRGIFVIVEKPFLRAPREGERFYELFQKIERGLGIEPTTVAKEPAKGFAA